MKTAKKVAILGGLRIPFTKSFTYYQRTSNQDMLTATLVALVKKYGLQGQKIGDVGMGAIMTHSSDWNLAREVVLGSGLHPHTPAYNLQRACGTSLESAWQLALKISAGQIESAIAGGSDTNSDLPVTYPRSFSWKVLDLRNQKTILSKLAKVMNFSLRDIKPQFPAVMEPRTGLSMGEHCEKMVQEWQIDRRSQDEWAYQSHVKSEKAYKEGYFDDLVIEYKGLKKDPIVRGDTTLEKLGKLKPAFDFTGKGTLTAGNSSPLSDGASAVLLGSEEWARERNLPILAYFVDAQVAAVDFVHGEGLLMAPTIAVSQLLQRNNLNLQDFDFYEIHEAFAGQVLCTLKAWQSDDYCRKVLGRDKAMGAIDPAKINVKGSSLAQGHPFAATGSRIVAHLAKLLSEKKAGRGLISICTAGGLGVTAILER